MKREPLLQFRCSTVVATIGQGIPKSEEHRAKIGLANRGRSRPDLVARNRLGKGRKAPVELRMKLSAIHKQRWRERPWKPFGHERYRMRLDRNHLPRFIRERISERDGYLCQRCHQGPPTHFNIHHIDWGGTNNEEDNLILLCVNCHGKVHHSSWSGKGILWPIAV